MKPQLPDFLISGLAVICGVLAAGATAPAQADSTPAGGRFLGGTAAWDMALVQEYFKKRHGYETDVPAQPAPFANQDVLDQVNPEFKKRIEALMAVCQSLGVNELGLTPYTGGLRTAGMQTELYKQGRRIKVDDPATDTVDESKRDGIQRDGSVKEDWELAPGGKVVTNAWGMDGSSWHQFGVAVDVAWCPDGHYNNSMAAMEAKDKNGNPITLEIPNPASPLHQKIWQIKAADAAASMGLCPGAWWIKPDLAHIEWHSRRGHSPPQDLRDAAGTALNDNHVNAGYRWKIPDRVFIWKHNVGDPKATQNLAVSDLVADGNWICLKKQRRIEHNGDGSWHGNWYSFDPPIKMFPTWIPTIALWRNEAQWNGDEKWRFKTSVTIESYRWNRWPDGVFSFQRSQTKGVGHFFPDLRVQDLQKRAEGEDWSRGDAQRWAAQQKLSVYDIEFKALVIQAGQAGQEVVTSKYRDSDHQGYTRDWDRQQVGYVLQELKLALGWDRDTGEIGMAEVDAGTPGGQPVALRAVNCNDRGDCRMTSAQLPNGAFDQENPPDWPLPKPRQKAAPHSGPLRS